MTSKSVPQVLVEALARARNIDGPIRVQLDDFAGALRQHHPEFADAVDRLVERLQHVGAGGAAPNVGERLPDFLLPDQTGHLVALGELLSEGPAAITFFRGHWCPYCQLHSRALAKVHDRVEANGATLVGITPELQRYTRKHEELAEARYRILSDIDNGYALSLNLAIWVGVEMQCVMTELGRDLASYQGNSSWFLPIPATFVVDSTGVIRARFIDPDYRKRMDADELVEALIEARHPPRETNRQP